MLIAHVVVSVGWLGLDAALLLLGVTGLATGDPQVMRSAYVAMGLIGGLLIVPLSVAALLTGLLLALGTPWGLFRHYWVLAKFVLTAAATLLVLLVLRNKLAAAAADALAEPAGELTGAAMGLRIDLVIAPSVALVVLVTATALSVLKPRGLTPFGRAALKTSGRAR